MEKLYLEIDTKSRSTLRNSISQLSISHETILLKRVISKPKGGIENIDLQDADLCISRRKSSQDAFTLHNTDTGAKFQLLQWYLGMFTGFPLGLEK